MQYKRALFVFLVLFIFSTNIIFANSLADSINSAIGNNNKSEANKAISQFSNQGSNDNSNNGTSKSNNSQSNNFEMTNEFFNSIPNIETRTFRFEFPDGSVGKGSRADFERIMREKYSAGSVQVGDNYYYRNSDGTFKTGWVQENNIWYYYDPELVKNSLKEINNITYYFDENGKMLVNTIININGIEINIDADGKCTANNANTNNMMITANNFIDWRIDNSNTNKLIYACTKGNLEMNNNSTDCVLVTSIYGKSKVVFSIMDSNSVMNDNKSNQFYKFNDMTVNLEFSNGIKVNNVQLNCSDSTVMCVVDSDISQQIINSMLNANYVIVSLKNSSAESNIVVDLLNFRMIYCIM